MKPYSPLASTSHRGHFDLSGAGELCIRKAVRMLLRACECAQSVNHSVWDFAVELTVLRDAGLTNTELRWLVCKGYVEHATEVTPPNSERRVFRPSAKLRFSSRTCVVLTEAGRVFAASLEPEDAYARDSSPKAPPAPLTVVAKGRPRTHEESADHAPPARELFAELRSTASGAADHTPRVVTPAAAAEPASRLANGPGDGTGESPAPKGVDPPAGNPVDPPAGDPTDHPARQGAAEKAADAPAEKRVANGDSHLPHWCGDHRTVWFEGSVVKQFKLPSPNQEAVLAAFEEEGWPVRIDDPLSPRPELDAKQRLHDTIRSLNRNQRHRLLTFKGDGTGQGILWEPYGGNAD